MEIIPLLLSTLTNLYEIPQTLTYVLKLVSRKAARIFFPIVKVTETMIVSTRKGLG